MQITIRTASQKDIPAIRELICESVRGLSRSYYSPSQIESALLNIFGVDTQLILDETYFVAEVGTKIAGSGGWSKRKTLFGGDQSKSHATDGLLDPETDAARIRAFYVHPDFARRGIGSAIVKACEAAAKAAGFAKLELVATLPGQPLYSAMGYEIVEPFEIQVADATPLPAFRMKKDLK